jgi:hypothetical protein
MRTKVASSLKEIVPHAAATPSGRPIAADARAHHGNNANHYLEIAHPATV